MKILSIDVGIINLAYCLIEIKDNTYKILSWDTINLCNETYVCKENLKKKICNRQAKYTKNNIYYCKSCAKKSKFIIPSNTFKKIHQKRTKLTRRVRRARQVVVAAHVALDLHELIRVERAIVATLTELKARPLPFVEPYHDAKFSTPCLLC